MSIYKIIGSILLLISSPSCAQGQEDKGALIPPTKIHITELIFANDLPQHYFIEQYDGYRLCRDSDIKKGWRDSFASTVLGTQSMNIGAPETCQITFLKKKRDKQRYDFNIKKHGCNYYFQMSDDVIKLQLNLGFYFRQILQAMEGWVRVF